MAAEVASDEVPSLGQWVASGGSNRKGLTEDCHCRGDAVRGYRYHRPGALTPPDKLPIAGNRNTSPAQSVASSTERTDASTPPIIRKDDFEVEPVTIVSRWRRLYTTGKDAGRHLKGESFGGEGATSPVTSVASSTERTEASTPPLYKKESFESSWPRPRQCCNAWAFCPGYHQAGKDAGRHQQGESMICGCCAGTCEQCAGGTWY